MQVEAAVKAKLAALVLLWDLSAFFDSIHWTELIPLAIEGGYPLVLLFMGWQVHCALSSRLRLRFKCVLRWMVRGGLIVLMCIPRPLLFPEILARAC